jgi:hypothetical protein
MKMTFSALGLFLSILVSASAFAAPLSSSGARSTSASSPIEISPQTTKFSYETFDGTANFPCKSTFAYPDNPYDFDVRCFDGSREVKRVEVHLAVSRYTFSTAPKTKYEILYWVNHEGGTTWLSFDDSIFLRQFDGSQSIPGDTAEMHLKINL